MPTMTAQAYRISCPYTMMLLRKQKYSCPAGSFTQMKKRRSAYGTHKWSILGSHRATENSGKPVENGWLINSGMLRKSEKLAMRESWNDRFYGDWIA